MWHVSFREGSTLTVLSSAQKHSTHLQPTATHWKTEWVGIISHQKLGLGFANEMVGREEAPPTWKFFYEAAAGSLTLLVGCLFPTFQGLLVWGPLIEFRVILDEKIQLLFSLTSKVSISFNNECRQYITQVLAKSVTFLLKEITEMFISHYDCCRYLGNII